MTLTRRFADAMAELLPGVPERLGVAVSGGGDSMALMHLAAQWGAEVGCAVEVVTVDHGLRPEAAAEAAMVAEVARHLGLHHATLEWRDWDRSGNLQDAARQARRRLIAEHAAKRGLKHVLLGHTQDDQAETVLLRLARGSGVDGLAGMAPQNEAQRVIWLRPVLGETRSTLRDFLRDRGFSWVDDPSNDDSRFDRVKARQTLELLAPLGLSAERLARTADHMRGAQQVLRQAVGDLARRVVRQDKGDLVVDLEGLRAAPRDLQTRLFTAALSWISGEAYRPRFAALTRRLDAVFEGEGGTLHGCRLLVKNRQLRLCREFGAVKEARVSATNVWDGRWCVTGTGRGEVEIAALGEIGLAQSPDWRESGRPRASLLSSPAIWQGDRLISAPLAGNAGNFTINLIESRQDFDLWVLSH